MRKRIHRPELGPLAAELRSALEAAMGGEEGISLLHLIRLFGAQPGPTLEASLEARGRLQVSLDGAVSNEGPPLSFKGRILEFQIPPRLAGHCELTEGGFILSLDPGASVLMKKGFLRARAARLVVDSGMAEVHTDPALLTLELTW